MANETLILGNGNWASKANSLLGYGYGDTSKKFIPREFTFSRGSIATYTDKNGVVQTAAANIARVQDDALLLEPQRTNSVRNSTMIGANTSPSTLPTYWVNGNTQGLTRSIVDIGTENGLNYIDIKYNGTATNTSSIVINFDIISASVGQTWTNSFYFKAISGNQPFFAATIFEFAAGYLTEGNVGFTPTSILTRYLITRTLTNASVTNARPSIQIYVTNGQSYDFTIRIAQPQMELGAYATTPIFTSGATATRLADTFTRNNIYTNGYIGALGGTWYVELKNNVSYTRDAGSEGLFIGDTSIGTTNSLQIISPLGGGRLRINKRIATIGTSLYTTLTDNAKIAIKWNGTTADVFVNGVKVVSATAFTTTNMEFLNGLSADVPKFIQSMQLYNTPLTDEELILKTTL